MCLQVLLRYQVQQGIAVIPKSENPHHLLENMKVRSAPLIAPSWQHFILCLVAFICVLKGANICCVQLFNECAGNKVKT